MVISGALPRNPIIRALCANGGGVAGAASCPAAKGAVARMPAAPSASALPNKNLGMIFMFPPQGQSEICTVRRSPRANVYHGCTGALSPAAVAAVICHDFHRLLHELSSFKFKSKSAGARLHP